MSKIGPRPLLESVLTTVAMSLVVYIYIDIQFRQIPMTAVAVEQYRPAMDSCMAGTRLCRTCALTAPDSSDPATGRVSGSVWAVSVGIF